MFELDDKRRDELVDRWARRIVERGLATPAIFLLEAHKPLAGLAAQGVLAFRPLLSALSSIDFTEVAALLRSVENVERLVQRIEELERSSITARRRDPPAPTRGTPDLNQEAKTDQATGR